jgi:hypothetical protein
VDARLHLKNPRGPLYILICVTIFEGMPTESPQPDQRAADQAFQLEQTYGNQAIAAAKAGLQASSRPDDIDFWASVCAILAVGIL